MRYFARSKFSRSSQEKFKLDMTSSFQVRIRILSREVGLALLNSNELGEKSRATLILGIFVNKP